MLTANHTRYKNRNQRTSQANQRQQAIILNHQLALRVQVQHHRAVIAQVQVVQVVPKAVVSLQTGHHWI